MKALVLSFTFVIMYLQLLAQPGTMSRPSASGRLFGKIVDAKTKKGLDAVSVQLSMMVPGGANQGTKDSIIAGQFTRPNGDFSFNNIAWADSLKVTITAIGYRKLLKPVSLKTPAGMNGPLQEIDLGNFGVEAEAQTLANVTVVATRAAMELGIDRRVFNVEKNLTATGGTAVDVMKNIPSVTVDVEGNVQLRNASPQIFVDGRPTILTLDQIPAENIEKVELITNPSAKFDASSNAGIINVVLKRNRKVGVNGTASLSVGSPRILSGNLNLNLRQGKFNFFASGNYNRSGGRADGKTYRQNLNKGVIDNYFNQFTWNDRTRQFQSVRFGFDYFLDNRNTISLTQNLVNGKFTNNEDQQQEYYNAAMALQQTGTRTSMGNNGFNRSGTQLVYTHKFANPGQQLSADLNYNKGSGNELTNILNAYRAAGGGPSKAAERVRNTGDNENTQFTAQVDYVNPIGENAKFEAGGRAFIQDNGNIFEAFSIGQTGNTTRLPLSNHYQFKETVNAGYVTFSNKINKLSYQAGLRAEISKLDGEIVDKGQKFGYSYPSDFKRIWDGLFPSMFITQSLGENEDLQLNYTRRIRRPDFRQLNPFINFNDPVNLRQGNPALRPEFTNSFEVNYNKNHKSGNFLAAVYYRNTVGDITEYSDTLTTAQYQQLNNAAIDSNAILSTFINSRSQNRWGADITLQQTIAKNLEIVPNISLQYRKVNAVVNNTALNNEGFSWEGKLIMNYKIEAPKSWLFSNLGFQLTGEYESPEVIPQGRRKEQYSVDFALRKDMFKNKSGTLTFSVNDVFNSNRFGTIYETENFYQDSYRRWNVRSFRLTFSYRFGDSNFSLFKKNNGIQRRDDDDDDNSGEGN
ncbi:TonB-dependent receptor [Segetibacter sp. 3557_3]|uniref:outer membrane beta-barrel family protein n=1 Tax=Segetibacter sp. 3557_3 TaxID=2547429 RepID=UPI001058A91B|nr:outer membrane beta-barrel family protein [Segetibacter sp. 3557_3]TDH28602.1 TonB-dependent receptor [Segetibacter sp. 3557_3]